MNTIIAVVLLWILPAQITVEMQQEDRYTEQPG